MGTFKSKKSQWVPRLGKILPTLILAYNATQHYSTFCSPARLFLGRETNLPHLSLLPKFRDDNPPQPHTLEEELDGIIDLMRRQDAVRIRCQFRACTGPIDDFKVNDLVYAAVLPPVGNSHKLHISWSGPLQITEIFNQAMVWIKELNVPKPCLYDAHVSKLRLAKKMGEGDPNPIFTLPRLPKEDMLQLADELSEINLPCKVNDEIVDEFYEDINHGSQHQDDDSSTGQIRSITERKRVSNKTEPIRSNTVSNDSNSSNITERRSQSSEEDLQEEESEDNHNLYQSFRDSDQSINQSINKSINQHSKEEDLTG